MSEASQTKTDRNTRRRIRRWQRRAQIAAPFLAVPAMLGLLILSVDLIEYQPNAPARPARPAQKTSDVRPRQVETGDETLRVDPQSVSALSVVGSSAPLSTGMEAGASADAALFADPMRAMPASSPSMP